MNAIFDALSHPIRREVLHLLHNGEMSAGTLADHFPVSKPTMSGHFAKLKAAGLVQAESRAGQVFYSVNMSILEEAIMGFMKRFDTAQNARRSDAGEPKESRS